MIYVTLVVLGLIIGSFLNALVYRLSLQDTEIPNKQKKRPKKKLSKEQMSVTKGRSVCTSCGHQLSYADLIPVLSWISLRGKCRYCPEPISAQYPLVELMTAGLFVFSYVFWPRDLDQVAEYAVFGLWLAILSSAIAISIYDIRWMLIPDKILRPAIVMSAASVILQAILADDSAAVIQSSAVALFVVGGSFLALYYGSKGKWIGGGDVKLTFFMSILLGVPGIFVALAVGFYGASIIIFPLLLLKKISRKQRVPFGPFLLVGLFVAALFSESIVDWYRGLFLLS